MRNAGETLSKITVSQCLVKCWNIGCGVGGDGVAALMQAAVALSRGRCRLRCWNGGDIGGGGDEEDEG
jgi:hypothetical protein